MTKHIYDIWKPENTRWIVIEDKGVAFSVTRLKSGHLSVSGRGHEEITVRRIFTVVETFEHRTAASQRCGSNTTHDWTGE